jgi:hypothetical protein
MTELLELVALCRRMGLPLTLAWHPDAETQDEPSTGWGVQVDDRSYYGALDDAVAKHLLRLRTALERAGVTP